MMPDAYPYAVRAVCTFIKKELASQLRDDLLAVVSDIQQPPYFFLKFFANVLYFSQCNHHD